MDTILKFLKDRAIKYSLLINLLYLVFFLIIIYNPTGGWGNIDAFISSIFYFPILIFAISFTFESFKDKLKFDYLSFIMFGFIVSKELNFISTNFSSLIRLFALIISPIILALLAHLVFYIYKKGKWNLLGLFIAFLLRKTKSGKKIKK